VVFVVEEEVEEVGRYLIVGFVWYFDGERDDVFCFGFFM
jgi:hypothetical protein